MPGPLDGVKVVDLTTTFMGPYCTLLLAQMGAAVVKVEAPSGDVLRSVGEGRSASMGPIFVNANRGKRSVVLDLKEPEAQEALLRLAEDCDVFVHNMRPSAAGRLRVDAASVLGRNPSLIHCTFRGFGDGPYADHAAYDDVVQAVSGVAATQGRDGEPEYVVTPIADKSVGLAGLAAVLAALYRRARSGGGEAITVPMFEFMVSYMLVEQQGGLVYEPPVGPSGYARTASPQRRPYPTKDGHVAVMVYTDAQWMRFFDLAGRADLADDPRFASIGSRTRHIDELYGLLADALAERTTEEWLRLLGGAGIPVMPIRSIDGLFEDEHLLSTAFFEHVDHPTEGALRQSRFPIAFERGAGDPPPTPRLGQHTREVLAEHGFSAGEIDRLAAPDQGRAP